MLGPLLSKLKYEVVRPGREVALQLQLNLTNVDSALKVELNTHFLKLPDDPKYSYFRHRPFGDEYWNQW